MRFSMLVLAVSLMAGVAHAQDVAKIPYLKNNLCPGAAERAYWAEKGFCYIENGKQVFYPLSDMGEIKLKDNGQWTDNIYVKNLSDESARIVDSYKKYYVRYMSNSPVDSNGVSKFVVHVFFNVLTSTQTIYVYGEMLPDGEVKFTGYQNSQGIEGDSRSILGGLSVIGEVIAGNTSGHKVAQEGDRTRIQEPARDVIKTYRQLKKEGKNPRVDRP